MHADNEAVGVPLHAEDALEEFLLGLGIGWQCSLARGSLQAAVQACRKRHSCEFEVCVVTVNHPAGNVSTNSAGALKNYCNFPAASKLLNALGITEHGKTFNVFPSAVAGTFDHRQVELCYISVPCQCSCERVALKDTSNAMVQTENVATATESIMKASKATAMEGVGTVAIQTDVVGKRSRYAATDRVATRPGVSQTEDVAFRSIAVATTEARTGMAQTESFETQSFATQTDYVQPATSIGTAQTEDSFCARAACEAQTESAATRSIATSTDIRFKASEQQTEDAELCASMVQTENVTFRQSAQTEDVAIQPFTFTHTRVVQTDDATSARSAQTEYIATRSIAASTDVNLKGSIQQTEELLLASVGTSTDTRKFKVSAQQTEDSILASIETSTDMNFKAAAQQTDDAKVCIVESAQTMARTCTRPAQTEYIATRSIAASTEGSVLQTEELLLASIGTSTDTMNFRASAQQTDAAKVCIAESEQTIARTCKRPARTDDKALLNAILIAEATLAEVQPEDVTFARSRQVDVGVATQPIETSFGQMQTDDVAIALSAETSIVGVQTEDVTFMRSRQTGLSVETSFGETQTDNAAVKSVAIATLSAEKRIVGVQTEVVARRSAGTSSDLQIRTRTQVSNQQEPAEARTRTQVSHTEYLPRPRRRPDKPDPWKPETPDLVRVRQRHWGSPTKTKATLSRSVQSTHVSVESTGAQTADDNATIGTQTNPPDLLSIAVCTETLLEVCTQTTHIETHCKETTMDTNVVAVQTSVPSLFINHSIRPICKRCGCALPTWQCEGWCESTMPQESSPLPQAKLPDKTTLTRPSSARSIPDVQRPDSPKPGRPSSARSIRVGGGFYSVQSVPDATTKDVESAALKQAMSKNNRFSAFGDGALSKGVSSRRFAVKDLNQARSSSPRGRRREKQEELWIRVLK